jgi:Arc/MetJ-type ribon-helix-helix transcriptional regulator
MALRLAELVSEGRFDTKADAVRAAIASLLDTERRRNLGEAIANGYRRIPQEADPELASTLDALAAAALMDTDAEDDHEDHW